MKAKKPAAARAAAKAAAAKTAAAKGAAAKRSRVAANSSAAGVPAGPTGTRRAPAAAVMKSTKRRVAAMRTEPTLPGLEPVPAARWPALKLEIVRRYAAAYSHVMSRQAGLAYHYIEGFAGPDVSLAPLNGDLVPGHPLNALRVEPPFRHHFLLDLDGGRAATLRRQVGERPDITLLEGDANELLLRDVLPRVRAEDYRRALCVLDPCGLRLDWRVLEAAGRLRTIDLFVSLPATDERGEPLWTAAGARDEARLTRAWGDDSWRDVPGDRVAAAFARRLREVARFENVLEPVPIAAGTTGSPIAGHLFFASRANTANHVLEEMFAPWRDPAAAGGPAGR